MSEPGDITLLLAELRDDPAAFDRLLPKVYPILKALAARRMQRESAGHTLSATALVHEAFEKLLDQKQCGYEDRAHFLAVASMAMRRVLWHHAEAKQAQKRGGGLARVSFADDLVGKEVEPERWLALDAALDQLEAMSERQAKTVVMRVYGGLSHEEIASVLGVSVPTVGRDWRLARAWLKKTLGPDAAAP